ncbi:glycosyltransferase family 2 protein [Peribacillus frigoritolerans]|uniref:glycosyltransferase family A protein n=1 Tax=Peribacillus frigoritolerans TaxID=450367 RepID=UPI0021AAD2B8|nr:glycosyltransferase family 2 protein [Peribacillus frigoritolerans]MCT4478537.1 glycosyltransferase family 2 protein [Peribacillus frigoritolerans]
MKNPKITVFTPTYNRAYILHQCYEALKRQTNKNFIWLIIDDGSTDNTEELVENWTKEKILNIHYHKQRNLGMHGAHNTAHQLLETELCIGCDSDDYLMDDCIEKVLKMWDEKGTKEHSGIIGLCANTNNRVWAPIPKELTETKLYDLRFKYKIRGDFKFALRSDLLKKEPYPLFEDENYVAVGYKYFKIDQKHKMLVLNDILCCQEYIADGEVTNKLKRYVTAPKGYMVYRSVMMPLMHSFKERWWQATHYVSSAIFAKERNFIKKSPSKFTTITAIPSGLSLYFYIKYKYKKKINLDNQKNVGI